MTAKFALGRVVATPAALEVLDRYEIDGAELLQRHHHGDWGNLDIDDQRRNDAALIDGSRIFSSYNVAPDASPEVKIWIITEAVGDDERRASTCMLLPSDY